MSTISFWEREELLSCDTIIVGAGIVGLSAAISIKEQQPLRDVVVLEREILPSGASTKNAGFACYGSLTEILHDVKTMGEHSAVELITQRKQGLDVLRKRLGDGGISLEPNGGYELLWGNASIATEQIEYVNKLMQPIFGSGYFEQRDSLITDFGFNTQKVTHLVATKHESSINSGKMMKNLCIYAAGLGVRIITGADVSTINEQETCVEVEVRRRIMEDVVCFRAENLIISTNALAPQFMPSFSLIPARGQVLITQPIPNLRFKGVFHFDEGFYYFRNVGNRVLFGGGRNMDFEGEATSRFDTTQLIQSTLEEYLRDVILPDNHFEIDMRWAGIMGFGTKKQPIVQHLSKRTIVAFGCNGMGVALGSGIGLQAAELLWK